MRILVFLFFLAGSILLINGAYAEVYKHTNPDGSVTFSDVPAKINAEPIELPPSSRYSPPPLPRTTGNSKPKKAELDYESVAITSPANDSAVRDNAGNLTVKFNAKPGLKPRHSYVLLMDGKNVGEGHGGSIQLTNLDRGSHTFIAQVVDENKKMVTQSEPVIVHLLRAIVR